MRIVCSSSSYSSPTRGLRAWADGRLEGGDDGRPEGDDDGRLERDDGGLPEAMGELCLAVEVLEADREGEGGELVLVF